MLQFVEPSPKPDPQDCCLSGSQRQGEDKNVPAEIIDQLASTYTKAGGNITISTYPNSVHGFAHSVGDDTDLFVEDLVSWLYQITEE